MPNSNPLGCSDAEWQTRCDLAASFQLCHHFGFADLVWTHLSARVPGEPDHFLLNPSCYMFDEVTASNLIKIDIEGNAVDGGNVNPAAFTIHSAVYRANNDYNCAMHLHAPHGSSISTLKEGLLPIHQFYFDIGEVSYHDYEGFALNHEERERIVTDLGQNQAMILRNHGTFTVGHSVAAAFVKAYYLEKMSEIQLAAMASNGELITIPANICYDSREAVKRFGDPALVEWPALLRMLSRNGVDAHLR